MRRCLAVDLAMQHNPALGIMGRTLRTSAAEASAHLVITLMGGLR
jgi:hypothetical protein